MGNWSNLRLVVTGHSTDLAPFRKAAGALSGRIDTSRSTIFTDDMEEGEGGDLEANGLQRLPGDFRRASYIFQGKNTDHLAHFRAISKHYPRLAFVLVAFDNEHWENGSYLLLNGRRRWWTIPEPEFERRLVARLEWWDVIEKGTDVDVDGLDFSDDKVDSAWWEAQFECMDVAEAHWNTQVLTWLTALPPAPVATAPVRAGRRGRG
jgi:hypothetical protein